MPADPPRARVAALSDIHGNLPAFEAVLDEVRRVGVDAIVVGGDVVPGPMPGECLDRLLALDLPVHCISGNGEREVLARRAGAESATLPEAVRAMMRWVAAALDDRHARAIAAWPATLTLEIAGLGPVLFCHATPRSDVELFTRLTPEALVAPAFAGVDAALVVCGHTHMQFDRTIGDHRVVNAGSVGMPFGEPGAHWLLLGPDVQLRRTPYDLAAAAGRIRATTYPQAAEFAEHNVLAPPSEDEMLAQFSPGARGAS